MNQQRKIWILYKKLLSLYPRAFRERFGESMLQAFNDLYNEHQQARYGLPGFATWTFTETAIGVVREHLLLIFLGGIMQSTIKTIGSSALISFLLILPFMIMEVVNTPVFTEGFPFTVFFVLWLNLLAVSLILLPILQAVRTRHQNIGSPVPVQTGSLLTNPKSALMISIALFLIPVVLFFLTSVGWEPLERLINGPNPAQPYRPGQIIVLALISVPIAAGMIASGPIVRALRTGGSLFAHPVHLIIVVVISFIFATGVINLLVDQWPCFMGVPNCD